MSVSYPKRGSVSRFVLLAMGSLRLYFVLGSLVEWLCAAKYVVPVAAANFPFVRTRYPFAGLEPSKGVRVGVRVRTRTRGSTLACYGSIPGASA